MHFNDADQTNNTSLSPPQWSVYGQTQFYTQAPTTLFGLLSFPFKGILILLYKL